MKKLFRKFFPARNRRGHRLGKWLAFHAATKSAAKL